MRQAETAAQTRSVGRSPCPARATQWARCRRRCGAISPPSATTRRCGGRARSCRSCASARSAAEDARMLIRENEQLLHESGLFRFHQPKAFGGMELAFVAVVDIPAELARGCPSTAWNVGNLACHHWILGYYEPETQREVWDANPDALIASSIALAAGRARKAEGGFIVNGRWPFSSAVDNSRLEHARRHRLRRRRQDADRLAAVPGAQVRLRDHRHLVRHGHGGHRQQGRRGHRAVRARAPRAAARALPRRARASRRGAQPRPALPAFRSSPPRAIRWRRRRSARPRAPTSCSSRRWPSGPAPIPAPGSRISRRCRSRWRARAA